MSDYYTRLERHLMHVHDQKITRCAWCGEWVYAKQDCGSCLLPQAITAPAEVA